ncbi:MAG: hypothetical protein SPJ62_11570 [Inconstantimicrobium porci]|uniref:Uncharacterized protein n=1 Tax=Inconstantimicrobium porci TaxID=2652291 RepID=A0A7X2N1G2_9CLOT|nr:hypothetical protein [Inconstantimicrobium porci]MDD6769543.1 hypothetical protein [Inconstantimicrobium porci]MDY5912617.1 hypothetical protein [Inconstantimicrobium porci]MSR92525.1 hypothetical protein [Inconstantimicrobium porci]
MTEKKQDIFDKLALKNTENLSDMSSNVEMGMSQGLQNLKISDDFSNAEQVKDQQSQMVYNKYVEINKNHI